MVALIFDFFNGVNDAANSIATVVATRVLRPYQAVLLAAVFNFIGPFLFGTAVAQTVGRGIITPEFVTTLLILGGLLGAIGWTWMATKYGIPISVSHALIGGLLGSGLAAFGVGALELPTWNRMVPVLEVMGQGAAVGAVVGALVAAAARRFPFVPVAGFLGAFAGSGLWVSVMVLAGGLAIPPLMAVFLFIFYSPLLGFIGGYVLNFALVSLFRHASPMLMQKLFGRLQIVSVCAFSLGHGTNDAQKVMGVITAVLVADGVLSEFVVPVWVIIAAASAIALGTAIGGYKVVQTMGLKLTHLQPYQGFSAETSGAVSLAFLAHFGVPVSTTHTIAGSIMGVGAVRGRRHVRWRTARTLVMAWVLTLPCAAAASFVAYLVLNVVFGLAA